MTVSSPLSSSEPDTLSIHGVFMNIEEIGVLITGASGTGKSDTALALIAQGHQLIADDSVIFSKQSPNQLMGRSPTLSTGYLAIREIGFIDILSLYGPNAVCLEKSLSIIIELRETFSPPEHQSQILLEIPFPYYSLFAYSNRNIPLLIEIIVKNHLEQKKENPITKSFCERQKLQLIEQSR